MDPGLESAVLDALERAETGADVSPAWLRRAHPQWWRDVQAFLRVHDGLHAGRPDIERIGSFRVRQRLGEGGMGTVYLAAAEHAHGGVAAGSLVAVKVVHAHLLARPRFLERALREARVGSTVVHENVVRTLDIGLVPGPPRDLLYLVTEHVDGQNLRGLIEELGEVPEDLCRHVAREVLRALVAVHAAGAVHRDLKPENVLLSRDGKVKVTDFGAAHALDPTGAITQSGEFLGSLPYAAPEQLMRPAARTDGRSDLYALGVVLHEMASGAHPFLGTPQREGGDDRLRRGSESGESKIVGTRLTDAPRLDDGVSAYFAAFVATLLAHEPGARFPSAAAALEALEAGEGSSWWSRTRAAAAERARRETAVSPRIVGRDAELARIRAAFDDAAGGRGRTLVLAGEAGVGKSMLAEEALARIARGAAPPRRFVARYEPRAAPDAPAFPWIAALRDHFAGDDCKEAVARHLADFHDLAAPFAALLRDDPTAVGASAMDPASQCAASTAVLRSLARERPVVLLVEDLHLADAVSRQRLIELARVLAQERVLVLVTTRPTEGDAPDDFDDAAGAERIVVGRLSPQDVHALLSGLLGAGLAAERALPAVQRRSDGNPFFVLELVRHLRDTGVIEPSPHGGWDLTGDPDAAPLPATLRATVERRLADLDPSDRRLLALAACSGFVFDPELVAEAAGRSPLDVLRALARIERRRRLVRSTGARCAFDHHVIQESLIASLDAAGMHAHHAALAGALEQRAMAATARPDAALAVFDHWIRAGDGPRASRWLTGALRRLEATCRPSEAQRLIQLALDLPGAVPSTRRAEVLVELAPNLHILGRRDEELAVLREGLALALASGPRPIAARARAELSRCLCRLGRHAEAETEAQSAVEAARALGDTLTEEIAQAVAGVSAIAMHRVDDGIRRHEEQLRIARESGDPARESDAEDCIGTALANIGVFAPAVGHLQRALDLVRGLPVQPAYPGLLRGRLANCLMLAGRWDEAAPLLDEQMRLSRRIGDVTGDAWTQLLFARLVERRGDRDGALRLARGAADAAGRFCEPPLEHVALRSAARYLQRSGRIGECLAVSAESRLIAERLGLLPGVINCRILDAEALSSVGAHNEALAAAAQAGDAAQACQMPIARRIALLARARCAAQGRGDPALLREVVRLARDEGDACGTASALLDLGLASTVGGDAAASDVLIEALTAGRALRDGDVIAPAAARLAALGIIAADAARDECALHAAALSVRAQIGVEHDLWRATDDPSHLDEARRQLDILWAGAPEQHRDSVITRVPLHQAVAIGAELT